MSLNRNIRKIVLCIALANWLAINYAGDLTWAMTTAGDQLSFADLSKLAECEKHLFTTTHTSLPSEQRLQALEKEVFGSVRQGSMAVRIANLYHVLGLGKQNLLLPPLAGQLDHETVYTDAKGAPAIAPQSTDNDRQLGPAPAPDRAQALLRQALQFYRQGKIDLAEHSLQEVIAIDKTNSDAYFNLGAIAESKGDLSSALSNYKAALIHNPRDREASEAVAAIEKKLQDLKTDAADGKNGSAATNSEAANAELRKRVADAALAYKQGDYTTAINILKEVSQKAPTEPDVQYALSQAYRGKGEYLEARSALQAALAITPTNRMYQDALADLDRLIANGGASNKPAATPGYESFGNNSIGEAANNGSVGQITPFSHDGFDSAYSQQAPNRSYWPGYTSQNGGMTSSQSMTGRIERAAIGTISGVAIGSLFGGGYYGRSRGSSALTGGLIGGMLGLFMGR